MELDSQSIEITEQLDWPVPCLAELLDIIIISYRLPVYRSKTRRDLFKEGKKLLRWMEACVQEERLHNPQWEAPWFVRSLRKTNGLDRGWRRERSNQKEYTAGVSAHHRARDVQPIQERASRRAGRNKKKRMINPSVVWERGGVREAHHQLLPRLCRFVAWGRRPSALAPNVVTWWPPSSLLDAGSAGASCAESKSPFQFCWNTVFFIYEHEHPSVHMVGVLYLGVGGYTTSRCRSLASTLSQVDLHRDAGLGQIHTWALKGVRQRVK